MIPLNILFRLSSGVAQESISVSPQRRQIIPAQRSQLGDSYLFLSNLSTQKQEKNIASDENAPGLKRLLAAPLVDNTGNPGGASVFGDFDNTGYDMEVTDQGPGNKSSTDIDLVSGLGKLYRAAAVASIPAATATAGWIKGFIGRQWGQADSPDGSAKLRNVDEPIESSDAELLDYTILGSSSGSRNRLDQQGRGNDPSPPYDPTQSVNLYYSASTSAKTIGNIPEKVFVEASSTTHRHVKECQETTTVPTESIRMLSDSIARLGKSYRLLFDPIKIIWIHLLKKNLCVLRCLCSSR